MVTNEDGDEYLSGASLDQWRAPFDSRCWICGSTDLSSEHKFKRSDLISMDSDGLMWNNGGGWQKLRSSNDNRARFRLNNLCQKCNNERAQPADRAWQMFSSYVKAGWNRLATEEVIDFSLVFGASETAERTARFREYVIRHFGCRISEAGFAVPSVLRSCLEGSEDATVGMCMFYSHERAAVMRSLGHDDGEMTMLSIGPVVGNISKSKGRPTALVTEICIGPVGILIKWSDEEPVGGGFGTAANLIPRAELPYPEIHKPVPDYSEPDETA